MLLGWRLAPDMFALARQVQVACDQAKNGTARLAGVEPPKFEDNETTLDQLKERIAKTVAFLKTLDAKAIDASADREITFPLGPSKGQMKGGDYLNHFVLPNFYFHLTAAYAIVRHCGVRGRQARFPGRHSDQAHLKRASDEKAPAEIPGAKAFAYRGRLFLLAASPPLPAPGSDRCIS